MTRPDSTPATDSPLTDDDEPDSSIGVEIVDQYAAAFGDDRRICRDSIVAAVTMAAQDQGFHAGSIGVLITGDDDIHRINREHLDHDYPTDVISFAYDADRDRGILEGELVVSVDTANRESAERGIDADDELLLYAIHGTLHIAGLDDRDDLSRQDMRSAEHRVLIACGIDRLRANKIVGGH